MFKKKDEKKQWIYLVRVADLIRIDDMHSWKCWIRVYDGFLKNDRTNHIQRRFHIFFANCGNLALGIQIGILAYLFLLEAMSPVLHVEGLRTRLGSVVVGRRLSVAPFVVFVAFHRCYEYMLDEIFFAYAEP
jgi:hypothetical protein